MGWSLLTAPLTGEVSKYKHFALRTSSEARWPIRTGGGGGGGGLKSVGLTHTPSTVFRHLPPNSAKFSYATEGALFISAKLSSDEVSAPERFGY